MRFVLGVFIGAVVTLCVAAVFDAPSRALMARGTSLVGGGDSAWNRLFLATGQAVFPAANEVATPPVQVPFQAGAASAPVLGRETQPLIGTGPSADVDPQPEDQYVSVPTDQAVDITVPAMEPLPEMSSPSRVATHEELVPPEDGTEVVWVPFRSQMSAEGFAARLTKETQHPFRVTRQGPGRYQVNFAYANEAQRHQLAQQIRAATGQLGQ